jgi:hypothetical protein
MSISAVPSSILNSLQYRPTQTPFQQDFQKLGQDLKSGNLSASQADFATLQQEIQNGNGADPIRHSHHVHAHNIKSGDTASSTGSTSLQTEPPIEPPILIGGGPFTGPPLGAPPPPRFISPPISVLA